METSQIVSVSLEEELKKNPRLEKSDIELLQEWCKKQPHLPKISDSSLALFLHSNHYLVEAAKSNIDNYYTFRTLMPDFFANRDAIGSKDVRQAFHFMMTVPLKTTTKEGYNIVFTRLIDPDPSLFTLNVFAKYLNMVTDLWLYRSGTIPGHVVVLDVQFATLGHAARCNPVVMKKLLVYIQEAMPVRLKGLHYYNVNVGMEAILKIMRPFLKKELLSILQLHSSVKTLKDFLPIEALPNEMGGKAGPLKELHEAGIKELEEYRDWFLAEEDRGRVDETKRPGKAKSSTELFGVDGSFKKLDLD